MIKQKFTAANPIVLSKLRFNHHKHLTQPEQPHWRLSRIMSGDDPRTKEVLDNCATMWYVGCWAHWGCREVKYAGFSDDRGVPYIWKYKDHNGTADQWELVPLTSDTTGIIAAWTISKTVAENLAKAMENERIKNVFLNNNDSD